MSILLDTHPKAFNNYVELIVRTADSDYIIRMIERKITNSNNCIQILKGVAKPENAKKISLILSKLKIPVKDL